MSYESKVQAARTLLEQHNTNVSDDNHKVDIDGFFNKLAAAGGTTEDALSEATWEDIENAGLPRLLARKVAGIFREKPKEESQETGYVSKKKAESMSLRELLVAYDKKEPDNPVGDVLARKSKGARILVFVDGQLDIDASIDELVAVRDGHQDRARVKVGTQWVSTFAVGDSPDCWFDVNPLFPTEALRPGDKCSRTGESWKNIPIEIRQFVLLAVRDTRELTKLTVADARRLIRSIKSDDGYIDLFGDYPETTQLFGQMKAKGELPSLKMSNAKFNVNGSGKRQDPFHGSSHKTH